MSITPFPPDPRDAVFDTTDLKQNLGRRAGNASVGVLAISALKVVILFAGIAVLARLVPPAEYGIFAMAMPIVGISLALSNFGLPQAIMQSRQIGHGQVSSLFWLNIAFAGLIGAAVAGFGGLAARLFDTPEVAAVYRVISLAVVLSAIVGQYAAILRRQLRVQRFEIVSLAGEAIGLGVAIATALAGWSYWALVAQQIASQGATMILLIVVTRWLPSSPVHMRVGPVLDAVKFGGYVAGLGILNKLGQYISVAVVAAQMGPVATGLFHRGQRLGNLPPLRVMAPLAGTFVSTLSRLQDDPAAMRAMFVRLISRSNLILMPAAVLIAAGAGPIVMILLGAQWEGVIPILAWMSITTLRAGANHGLRYVVLASGQSRPLFFNAVLRFGIVMAVILVSAPYGVVTMTAAYMLTELFITLPMVMRVALRHSPIDMACIFQASLKDMLLAVGLAGVLMVGVNPVLSGLGPVLHLGALMGIIGAAYAVRIAVAADLRHDVLGIIMRVLHRVRPGGGKAQ